VKVTLFHHYTDEIAAMLSATAPLDFPMGDMKAQHDAGNLCFAVAEKEGALVAAVAYRHRLGEPDLEIVGLNALAEPFAIRALWEKLEAYALGSTDIERVTCMVERATMQKIVTHWGMSPRAVLYMKAVA